MTLGKPRRMPRAIGGDPMFTNMQWWPSRSPSGRQSCVQHPPTIYSPSVTEGRSWDRPSERLPPPDRCRSCGAGEIFPGRAMIARCWHWRKCRPPRYRTGDLWRSLHRLSFGWFDKRRMGLSNRLSAIHGRLERAGASPGAAPAINHLNLGIDADRYFRQWSAHAGYASDRRSLHQCRALADISPNA
jgi:hypothetical protein